MIRHHVVSRRPRVDVDVFIAGSLAKGRAHIYVVKRLRVHIVHVRVSLNLGRPHEVIQIREPGNVGKHFQRLDEYKLVEITCSDDGCRGIEGENLRDKVLCTNVSGTQYFKVDMKPLTAVTSDC